MSRWIEEKDGKIVEEIADPDACRYLCNEICCNEQSDNAYGWIYAGMCEQCELFEKDVQQLPVVR